MILPSRALVLLFLLTAGCEAFGPPVKVDLSSPRSAAMEYLQAVQRADARAAHASSFGTAEQRRWVDGRITMVDGMRKFDNALYAKFGQFSSQVHTDLHDELLKLADIWVLAIKDGTLVSTEDAARIDPKNLGFVSRSAKVTPIVLHRDKDGWRVDIGQTYAADVPTNKYQPIDDYYRQSDEYGQIFRGVAADVSSGKFTSADAAEQALAERVSAKFKSDQ